MISISTSTSLSPQANKKKETDNEDKENEISSMKNQNVYHDELLDEFLDTQMYDDPAQLTNEILRVDMPKLGVNFGLNSQSPQGKALFTPKQQVDQQQGFFSVDPFQQHSQISTPSSFNPMHAIITATEQNGELQRYQEAKNELMKLKFGEQTDDDDDSMECGESVVSDSSFKGIPESSEMCRSPVPAEYLTVQGSELPYQLQVVDLPSYSRVETQIKLKLSISPAPSQYLLHFPRDTIAKPKLTLKDSEIPESIRPHMLFLDSFVVGSEATENMTNMQSFNVCRKCMRRELKRASRRKSNSDKSCGWSLDTMKRAIIFNCKEVVSFPQPSADPEGMAQRNMEVFSRVVCYCRHHQEPKGFRLFFVLKDHTGKVLGKTLSSMIMIMDRKKSVKAGSRGALSSKASPGIGTSADDSKTSVSALSENSSDYLSTGAAVSARSLDPSFSFRSGTAAPPSFAGVGSKARSAKRQKRSWSSNDHSSLTYFDGVSQPQRSANGGSVSSTASVKNEAISPLSSDTLSPQNNMYMSSATSVFSTTPEKKSFSGASSTSHGLTTQQAARTQQIGSQQAAAMRTSLSNASSSLSALLPSIQRIIPAQGPIRGGVEVTLLGTNFRPGMGVKFGANLSLATHCWSDSTLVTYLPPAAQAGPVLVTIQDPATGEMVVSNPTSHQIFTYTDDSDRQLIELALQIVGLKMNGRLEDAENIAKRIIGSSHDGGLGGSVSGSMSGINDSDMDQTPIGNSARSSWLTEASNRIKQFSKGSSLDQQDIIVRFLSLLDLPNSPVVSPNWAICTLEGQTILHLACLKGYFKLGRYLIEHGAKIDPRDANNLTPLHYAFIYGNRDLIALLTRCKASTSQFIAEGVALKDISDPNVLDLLDSATSGTLSREESIDSLYSLANESNSRLFRESGSVRAVASGTRTRRDVKFFASDSEIEADSEDNTDYSISEMSTEANNVSDNGANTNESVAGVLSSSSSSEKPLNVSSEPSKKHGKNIGLQFWMAMRGALNLGVEDAQHQDDQQPHVQSVSDDTATMTVVDETLTLVDERKTDNTTIVGDTPDDEILPSYDDLFPNGGNWRFFINFGGKERKGLVTTSTSENESDPQSREEEVEEAIISLKSKQRLNSDKRLMFFWLPFMLVLLCIVVGSRLNIVSLNRFPAASKVVEGARDFIGSIMLGKDRFTDLLNENWSFGRERVNKVFNDMNDAMMTAVGGAR